MNRIIWVFGCSASGKETFIKNVMSNNSTINDKLNIDYKHTHVIHESINLISMHTGDSIEQERENIPNLVIELSNNLNDSIILIKGQNSDIRNNLVYLLKEKLPDAIYEIIYLHADLEILIDRVKKKPWFDESRGFDKYIKSISDTLHYMECFQGFNITYIESNEEYKITEFPKLKAHKK